MNRAAFAVCALVLGALIRPAAAQESRPAIVFDSLVKDFGHVVEGETVRHVFKFTNKGDAPLQILNVEKP